MLLQRIFNEDVLEFYYALLTEAAELGRLAISLILR